MKKCDYIHVGLQVPDNEWRCPKCGVGSQYKDEHDVEREGWLIQESCNFDCEKLHDDDVIECESCGKIMSGEEYSKWYASKSDMVKCPCCKGKGVVKRGKK